jgi:hypothetical protein
VQPLGPGSVDDSGTVKPSEPLEHPVGIAPRAATVDTTQSCGRANGCSQNWYPLGLAEL